jgi:chitodextrinase
MSEFLRDYPFFDGVDIDWEYPGGGGANTTLGQSSDGGTYVVLMRDLRNMLDNLEIELGKPLQLTSAIGAAPEKISQVDYNQAQQYLDYIFLMNYDYHGAWSNNPGYLSNLYHSEATPLAEPFNVENSVQSMLNQGVYADKLVLGHAFYGRAWQGLPQTDSPFSSTATGAMQHNGFWEDGIGDYKLIRNEFMNNPFWEYGWDDQAQSPYLWNKSEGKLITLDDARSVEAKSRWASQQGLAGVFSWEIDADNGDLLNAAHQGLGHFPMDNTEVPDTPEYNDQVSDGRENTGTQDPETGDNQGSNNAEGFTMSRAELSATEAELTSGELMTQVKQSIATRDNSIVEAVSAGNLNNPSNVKRVESMVTAYDWGYLFPVRSPEYSYENYLKAVAKFPSFCGDYDDGRDANAICRRSLATMFAHFTQETGGHSPGWNGIAEEWRQGLVHVREMGWDETMRGGYNGECNPTIWQGETWPCGTFANGDYKSYFGRGAKQLSYNYNYGPFSEAMFGDVRVLLDHPELVADTWLNLASAVFFFVYPQPPKPSMLHVIDGTWQPNARDLENNLTTGFGVTTQIINGGVECGGSTEIAQSRNRISYYQSFSAYLGNAIPSSEILGCAAMKQFDAQGDGALQIYWEQNWDYVAENPNGEAFACKLVGYQTPFSAFKSGDYEKCVQYHFDVNVIQ